MRLFKRDEKNSLFFSLFSGESHIVKREQLTIKALWTATPVTVASFKSTWGDTGYENQVC